MKVFLDYHLNDSGKGKFLKRLIPCLNDLGVKISHKEKGCDIALGVVKWYTKMKQPKILRIDGIHLNGKNGKIKNSMEKSDAVIFQSKFAKKYIMKHLNPKIKKSFVIYNGADPNYYTKVENRSGCLMAANWGNREHKRLKDHIKYSAMHPSETFYLAGHALYKSNGNLEALGYQPDISLRAWQSKCEKFIYLADIDWCPNVVVEALVAGMKVIYNPKCEAVKELCNLPVHKLYIQNVAKKYKKAFEAIL